MPLEDEIDICTPRWDRPMSIPPSKSPLQQVLVFFITGNPGLIEYYRTFLNQLSARFESDDRNTSYRFYGASLGGFELSRSQSESQPPFSLDEQAQVVQRRLDDVAYRMAQKQVAAKSKSNVRLPVILVGHSVGAYILLETIAWRQKNQEQHSQPIQSIKLGGLSYEIVGGICLFPTVVDIAKSPNGKLVTVSTDRSLC